MPPPGSLPAVSLPRSPLPHVGLPHDTGPLPGREPGTAQCRRTHLSNGWTESNGPSSLASRIRDTVRADFRTALWSQVDTRVNACGTRPTNGRAKEIRSRNPPGTAHVYVSHPSAESGDTWKAHRATRRPLGLMERPPPAGAVLGVGAQPRSEGKPPFLGGDT